MAGLQIEGRDDPTGLLEAGLAETEDQDSEEQADEGQE